MRAPVLAMLLSLTATASVAQTITGTASVRDGDTIVVAGTPVRLNGVDAPENGAPGSRAAQIAMVQLTRGKPVTCSLNGDRTYDRWVGVCYVELDGATYDLGALLIANGLALDCARYSGGRYRHLEPTGVRTRLGQARYC